MASKSGDKLVTLPEVRHLLEKERDERGELTYEQKLAFEHADNFTDMKVTKARKLFKELQEIERISPEHAAKIVELAPRFRDDVEVVFAKDRFELDDSDIDKVLELVGEALN